jgi:hypothetical protein
LDVEFHLQIRFRDLLKTEGEKMKNIEKKIFNFGLCLCLALANVITALAGGALEEIDITGNQPSPIPGQIVARLVGIKWDARSIPVKYSMNNTLDPIPNPLDEDSMENTLDSTPNPPGEPALTLAQAQAALQMSFDAWNQIPTSFIDMRITGTTANQGLVGFDFVNELSFRTADSFRGVVASPSTSLMADVDFAAGDDIDGDGDSDVAAGITVTTDVDGDGDIEFPVGFYKAGTILDNDVQFNTKDNGFRFTVGDAELDRLFRSVDLNAVATHEFGHSHGLSDSFDNQTSGTNGDGATMFPGLDSFDPAAESGMRSLSTDDIAWSSYLYPEGSAPSGPAKLQGKDKAFNKEYGLIKGSLTHGILNQSIAGGCVFAVDLISDERVASGFSGTTQLSFDPVTGGLSLVDPSFNILNGNYVIPVPKGLYAVGVEAVDGAPAPPAICRTCQIGASFGQQNFNEEFYNRSREDAREVRLGEKFPVLVLPPLNLSSNINIVTSDSININNFNRNTTNTFGDLSPIPGRLYAAQITASQIAAFNRGGEFLIQGVAFDTFVFNRSTVPVFAKAVLTTGTVNGPTATIDLAHPLAQKSGFVGQDNDLAPLYFLSPRSLGAEVKKGIEKGQIQNLFIVLQLPTTTPFPGVDGVPPLVGLDVVRNGLPNDPPIGRSFSSIDGGATWTQVPDFNFRFSLVVSRPLDER